MIFEDDILESADSAENEFFSSLDPEIETVKEILDRARLTEKQRFVIERRYGMTDGKVYTQREIADLMGISKRTVSDYESAAKKKLDKVIRW